MQAPFSPLKPTYIKGGIVWSAFVSDHDGDLADQEEDVSD